MTQGTLFTTGYQPPEQAPSHGHPNSQAAAATVNLPKRRAEVLACIAENGPISDERGIELTGMANGWRARRIELAEAVPPLIEVAGQGVTKAGNVCDLWRLSQERGQA